MVAQPPVNKSELAESTIALKERLKKIYAESPELAEKVSKRGFAVESGADPTKIAWERIPPQTWNPDGVELPYAVPEFLNQRPPYLDGSLVGDVGFDPLCMMALSFPIFLERGVKEYGQTLLQDLSGSHRRDLFMACTPEQQHAAVTWMRESELKHARLAMLAVAGWPIAEMINSEALHENPVLNGRAPSLFNGELLGLYGPFFFAFAAMFGVMEAWYQECGLRHDSLEGIGKGGDFFFDPLKISKDAPEPFRRDLALKELKNGRLAMVAITGFAVQEFVWGTPVVEQTPFFFGGDGNVLDYAKDLVGFVQDVVARF